MKKQKTTVCKLHPILPSEQPVTVVGQKLLASLTPELISHLEAEQRMEMEREREREKRKQERVLIVMGVLLLATIFPQWEEGLEA